MPSSRVISRAIPLRAMVVAAALRVRHTSVGASQAMPMCDALCRHAQVDTPRAEAFSTSFVARSQSRISAWSSSGSASSRTRARPICVCPSKTAPQNLLSSYM